MKTFFYHIRLLLYIVSAIPFLSSAQTESAKTKYLTVTTLHWDATKKDLNREEWLKVEREYFDKVTSKNPYIKHSNILSHYLTPDNTEIVEVKAYDSWEDIDKSWVKMSELTKAAWSDDKIRKAFFEKKDAVYNHEHSDEIYMILPDQKPLAAIPDKQLIYYVRKSIAVSPSDGTSGEFENLNKEFMDNILYKNDVLKAYYTYLHAWGSKADEFIEVFVVENLGDIEKLWKKNDELSKAYWKDENKRKEFFKKYDRYFSKTHGDYIYRNEVGLQK